MISETLFLFATLSIHATELSVVLYNAKIIQGLVEKLQENNLLCSKINQNESNEIFQKYSSKANTICGLWQFSAKFGIVVWSMKPIIILIYLNLTTLDNLPFYPKVLPLSYPFAIDNFYIYSLVLLYESVTFAVLITILTSQYVVIIVAITMMTGQFAILKTALGNLKYLKEPEINYVFAWRERKVLYDKFVDCIKSHQELLT